MAVSFTHTFSNGTTIDGTKLEDNVNNLRNYVNGGVSTSDFGSDFAEYYHMMKGSYIATPNIYELMTGPSMGHPDIPRAHGFSGKVLGGLNADDNYLPGNAISFYMEHSGDLFLSFNCYPRAMDSQTGASPQAGNFAVIQVNLDGVSQPETKCFFMAEVEPLGDTGHIPIWERRMPIHETVVLSNVSAGYHNIYLEIGMSNRQSVFKYISFDLQGHYDLVS